MRGDFRLKSQYTTEKLLVDNIRLHVVKYKNIAHASQIGLLFY